MKLQQLLSSTRKAVDDYKMIQKGDRIAIGISGGKDSLAMLYALSGLKRFYPNSFDIEAISVHLGFDGLSFMPIRELCENLHINYTIVDSDIYKIVFHDRKERNPCSLCAKMRKGVLNEKAKELGCNKVAYAHHKDDIIETMLLSMLFEGRFYSFSPVTYLDRSDLTVIRPLMYAEEDEIKSFEIQYNLPVQKNPCPADGHTKREYAKNLIKQLEAQHTGVKDHMFHAILNGNIPGWPSR